VKATATATRRSDPSCLVPRVHPARPRSEPGGRPRTTQSRGSPHPRRGSWEPPRRPLDHQLLTDRKRPPPSQHGLQRRPDRCRVTSTPRVEVGVDDPLGLVQLRSVCRDQLPPGLGPTAPDALERGPFATRFQKPSSRPRVASTTNWARSCGRSIRLARAAIVVPWNRRCLGSSARQEHSRPSSDLENMTFMWPS
jgi:hypothetical protein